MVDDFCCRSLPCVHFCAACYVFHSPTIADIQYYPVDFCTNSARMAEWFIIHLRVECKLGNHYCVLASCQSITRTGLCRDIQRYSLRRPANKLNDRNCSCECNYNIHAVWITSRNNKFSAYQWLHSSSLCVKSKLFFIMGVFRNVCRARSDTGVSTLCIFKFQLPSIPQAHGFYIIGYECFCLRGVFCTNDLGIFKSSCVGLL